MRHVDGSPSLSVASTCSQPQASTLRVFGIVVLFLILYPMPSQVISSSTVRRQTMLARPQRSLRIVSPLVV